MRNYWEQHLLKMANPLINALVNNRLKKELPLAWENDRYLATYMESFGRILSGIAPYVELSANHGGASEEFKDNVRVAISHGVDPESPDYLWVDNYPQLLVDISFFAHALLRAPNELFLKQSEKSKMDIKNILLLSRKIVPYNNNWILFSGIIEAAMHRFFNEADKLRVTYCIRQFESWYLGDGIYGDGAHYANDYYNSFVIQPMLLDIYETCKDLIIDNDNKFDKVLVRAKRYAQILERMINVDGSFPAVGRSIVYRCGAFHHLAHMSYKEYLPDNITPSQARCGLSAVISRTLDAKNTYDKNGFLHVGLSGHQESLKESYINTGSSYLASFVFLPLGLPCGNSFWSTPDSQWSSQKIWSGIDCNCDKKLEEHN